MGVIHMKTVQVEFSNEQVEILEQISKMCDKNASDFIREALVCLLPLDEYAAVKNNHIIVKNKNLKNHKKEDDKIDNRLKNINLSTTRRLHRIGML